MLPSQGCCSFVRMYLLHTPADETAPCVRSTVYSLNVGGFISQKQASLPCLIVLASPWLATRILRSFTPSHIWVLYQKYASPPILCFGKGNALAYFRPDICTDYKPSHRLTNGTMKVSNSIREPEKTRTSIWIRPNRRVSWTTTSMIRAITLMRNNRMRQW